MCARKNEKVSPRNMSVLEDVSRAAARIATEYMNTTGESLRSFAKKMDMSHVSMSYLLRWGKPDKEEEATSRWSLDALVSLSNVLQMGIANLFALMEEVGKTGKVPHTLLLVKYPPCSKERLECIIRHSMKYDAKYCEETGKPFPVVLDMGELPWKCPDFVREYISGTLTDDEAYLIINHVDPFGIDPVDPYIRIKEGYMAFKSGTLKTR